VRAAGGAAATEYRTFSINEGTKGENRGRAWSHDQEGEKYYKGTKGNTKESRVTMSSCEAVGDRCASAQARLEGLGRDAVDGEVSPALTAELTDVNIARATTRDVGRMETEKRRKERRNERTWACWAWACRGEERWGDGCFGASQGRYSQRGLGDRRCVGSGPRLSDSELFFGTMLTK
jgi:hypothetical protein